MTEEIAFCLFGLLRICWLGISWCGFTRWSRTGRALVENACAIHSRSRENSWLYLSGSCSSVAVVTAWTWSEHNYLTEDGRTRQDTKLQELMESQHRAILAWHGQGWWTLNTTHLGGICGSWQQLSPMGGQKQNRTQHEKKSIITAALRRIKNIHGLLHYIVTLFFFLVFL